MAIAAISLWEIAKLVELGRIELTAAIDDVLQELESGSDFTVLPLDARVALESTRLGSGFHRDPADQLIVATARVHALRLVTADERIRRSSVVATV